LFKEQKKNLKVKVIIMPECIISLIEQEPEYRKRYGYLLPILHHLADSPAEAITFDQSVENLYNKMVDFVGDLNEIERTREKSKVLRG